MGIDPAFNFICIQLRPYSKMLTLPMVHPVPRKLAGHPWPAHAIFFNGLKFRVEFVHFQVSMDNTFLSGRRHLLPSAAPLRTQRATFTALGSSLHKSIV
jgi:hypothetical protein